MKNLSGKIAIVTGGSRGIGAAITLKLASEGANVVFTYQNSADKAQALAAEIKNTGGTAVPMAADSSSPEDLKNVIENTVKQFGKIDILVNNAGIYVGKPFEEYTFEDYQLTMDVNVRAVFLSSQEAVRHMPQGSRIISIGSNMAENAIGPQTTLYTMSKSALQGFTRGLARDLGPKKITVNLVQPGPINTDMNPDNTEFADFLRTRMATGEYGKAEDIANTVAFLAGKDSNFITGAFITVDGGFNA
ncbi:3-oxoacyl-[acyl-carrier protein] reductase [Chryseobacterium arachidis]|uniref:3-oxoacyl-[acyl-carrier protein] reductase n=1 Tax=Chryseobacterium arachidis TaxID=1416778 RepID=A0A1M5FTW1_9FLAO|nr:3-oxoacyl-ACP reductase family protein [Chryseobacterium arachidis]SHF94612.1 3-oxoacyl-[acyl-carrier protein] reductase [Chryseobacterium arachidis]